MIDNPGIPRIFTHECLFLPDGELATEGEQRFGGKHLFLERRLVLATIEYADALFVPNRAVFLESVHEEGKEVEERVLKRAHLEYFLDVNAKAIYS